jgi:hypothetical protein
MVKKTIGAALILSAALLIAQGAKAQLSSMLPSMSGSSGSSALSGLSGMGMPSLGSASPTNIAGLLQYCVQNNDLSGSDASAATSTQQSLLSKVTGSSSDPTSDSSFTSGASGMLDTGDGKTTSLGGSGVQAEVTQKVCSQVLSHAKSLL